MSSNNSVPYYESEYRVPIDDVSFGVFPQSSSFIKKHIDQQGISIEQQLSHNLLHNYNAWRIQENDEQVPDPVSFACDIMKIISENPKLYHALAEDKYES